MGVNRDLLRQSYDRNAGKRATHPLPEWRVEVRERWITTVLAAGARSVVDLGAGTGTDARAFAEAGLVVTALDLSPEHVAFARDNGLDAVVGDLVATGLPDDAFHAAWSASAFMHLGEGEFEDALGEVTRVVAPGGLVCLGLWGGVDFDEVWEEDFHVPPRRFIHRSDDRLIELVGAVLDITSFWTDQTGFRPEIHYQWIEAQVRS